MCVNFLGTTTLFRSVKGAPKSACIRDKKAKNGLNMPKFSIFYAARGTSLKKTPLPVVAVVTNISYAPALDGLLLSGFLIFLSHFQPVKTI